MASHTRFAALKSGRRLRVPGGADRRVVTTATSAAYQACGPGPRSASQLDALVGVEERCRASRRPPSKLTAGQRRALPHGGGPPLLRPGSPARSRGTQRRGGRRPVGSTTRGCDRPIAEGPMSMNRRPSPANTSGSRAGRRRRRGRTAGRRRTSWRRVAPVGDADVLRQASVLTPSGSPVGSHPLPTTDTSRSTSRWRAAIPARGERPPGACPSTTPQRRSGQGPAHRSLLDVRIAGCARRTYDRHGQRLTSSHWVPSSPRGRHQHRGHQSNRVSPPMEDPVEREEPGHRAQPADAGHRRLRRLRAVLEAQHAGRGTGHVHRIVECLVEQDKYGEQGAQRGPATDGAEPAVGRAPPGRSGSAPPRCSDRPCRGRCRPARRFPASARPPRRSSPKASAAGRAAPPESRPRSPE